MTPDDEFTGFTPAGDPREEALWRSYRDLRRRKRFAGQPDWLDVDGGSQAPPASDVRPAIGEASGVDGSSTRPERRSRNYRAGLAVLLVGAAGTALAVAVIPRDRVDRTLPATGPTLRVRTHDTDDGLTARRALPCFVNGRPAGDLTVAQCAKANGVASGPLGVGLSGAVSRSPAPTPVPATPREDARVDLTIRPSAPVEPDGLPAPPTGEPTTPPPPSRSAEQVARAFYEALGNDDGGRATMMVIPEKRAGGPLSADALTDFYSALQAPLRITEVVPVGEDRAFVRYQYVSRDGKLCSGSSNVTTTVTFANRLVQGIRASDSC